MFFAKIFFYVHTTGLSFELGTFLCLDAAHEHLKGTKTGSLDVICQEMRGGFKLLHSIVPFKYAHRNEPLTVYGEEVLMEESIWQVFGRTPDKKRLNNLSESVASS